MKTTQIKIGVDCTSPFTGAEIEEMNKMIQEHQAYAKALRGDPLRRSDYLRCAKDHDKKASEITAMRNRAIAARN